MIIFVIDLAYNKYILAPCYEIDNMNCTEQNSQCSPVLFFLLGSRQMVKPTVEIESNIEAVTDTCAIINALYIFVSIISY